MLTSSDRGDLDSEFLGQFTYDTYTLTKSFIEGEGTHLRLYTTRLTPKQPPVATICIIHGFGEHSGRFRHIAQNFISLNYEALLVDMRGFGYSGGPRGCSEIEDLQRDVIGLIKQANPDLPLFLYGHSLGGLVLLTMCYEYPHINVSGIILTSPLIGFPMDRRLPWIKAQIVKLIGKKLEDFVVNSMVNPTALTKSNKHIQTIFGDRLMIPFLSVKMARSILMNVEKIQEKAPQLTTPIMIMHGKQDSVTSYTDSVHFMENVGSKKKSLNLFDNGYHELQHDQECHELLMLANKWLSELPTLHLGPINLQRRRHRRHKLPWGWIIFAVLYLLAVIKLSRKMPPTTTLRQSLLAPIMFLLNSSR